MNLAAAPPRPTAKRVTAVIADEAGLPSTEDRESTWLKHDGVWDSMAIKEHAGHSVFCPHWGIILAPKASVPRVRVRPPG